jgi:WD40 repeat protein
VVATAALAVACLLLIPAVLYLRSERDTPARPTDEPGQAAVPEVAKTVRLVEVRQFPGHNKDVNAVAFSRDGAQVLTGGVDGKVRLWDVWGGPPLKQLTHGEMVWGVAFLPDGRRAVTAGGDVKRSGEEEDGTDFAVRLWDLDAGKELRRFPGHDKRVTGLALSADGSRLLTGSLDNTIRLWDVGTGRQVWLSPGHAGVVWCVALSADGRWALAGDGAGGVTLWDTQTNAGHPMKRHGFDVLGVALAPDGRRALSGAVGHLLRLSDVDKGEIVREFRHPTGVASVAFSPDGRRAVSTSGYQRSQGGGVEQAEDDYRVRLWDLATGWELARSEEFPEPPTVAVFSPNGHFVLCGGEAGHLLEIREEPAAPAVKP